MIGRGHAVTTLLPAGFMALLALAVSSYAGECAAQSPAPLPNPNLELWAAPQVRAIARLPDGSVIVGGNFTSVYDRATQLSFERINLAKFSSTGALDLSWAPRAQGTYVYALAPDGAGSVFVGGAFTSIGGEPRPNLAKLSTSGTGAVDVSWNAAVGNQVVSLALSVSGDLFVGGRLQSIGGQPRANLAKLSAATALADPSWDPAPTCLSIDCVESIVIGSDGALYVGGSFSAIGGQSRSNLARLSTTGAGAADPVWNPGVVDGDVYALASGPGGIVYAGGFFANVGGQARFGVAKLSGAGGAVDPAWTSQYGGYVQSIALDSANRVILGGTAGVLRMSSSDGNPDPSWSASVGGLYSGWVNEVIVDPGGVVTVGGDFGQANGQAALGLARLSSAGALLTTSYVQRIGAVEALVRGSDGSIFVAGDFARAGTLSRPGLLKLNAGGSLDTVWNPSPVGRVRALGTTAGALIVGGSFVSVAGQNVANLARLSTSGAGAVDATWNPAPSDAVLALAVDANGNVYAGGSFTFIGGQFISYLAKVTAAGAVDPVWNFNPTCVPNSGPCVLTLAIDSAGSVFVGGYLTSLGGQLRSGLAKITSGGAVDPVWDPSPACPPGRFTCIGALAPDSLGNLYVGGTFQTLGGQQRRFIARVATTGAGQVDPAWNPSADNQVESIKPDGIGSVYVGGYFNSIGGQTRPALAKLTTSGSGDAIDGWNPSPTGGFIPRVDAIEIGATGTIYAGGQFTQIGGQGRLLLGALPPVVDVVFLNGFE